MSQLRAQLIAAMGMGCELSWDCPNPVKDHNYEISEVIVLDSKTASVRFKNDLSTKEIPLEQILILPKRDVADVKVSPRRRTNQFLNYFVPIFLLASLLACILFMAFKSNIPPIFIPAGVIYIIFCIKVLSEIKR